jgi:hypothetical protein
MSSNTEISYVGWLTDVNQNGKRTVVIPMFQRDYAQGRKDKRTTQVRERFAESLAQSICENERLSLGLVFGSQQPDSEIWHLHDGQQRLTTLHLLHWYVAARANLDCWPSDFLNRFRYETQIAARDFCANMASSRIDFKDVNPSKAIQEQGWFHPSWERDQSVSGMLVMLDALHAALGKAGINDWSVEWQKLTSKEDCPIRFHWQDMGPINAGQDFYIKLNGRGRSLTDFEHFKAWLVNHLEKEPNQEDWKQLDTHWTDLFWTRRNEEGEEIGDAMLSFFHGVVLNLLLAEPDSSAQKNLVDEVIKGAPLKREELQALYTKGNVENLFHLLKTLSKEGFSGKLHKELDASHVSLFEDNRLQDFRWLTGWHKSVLVSRALAFAAFDFIRIYEWEQSSLDSPEFSKWMRLVRNLVENSTLNNVTFPNVIRSLRNLLKKIGTTSVFEQLVKLEKTDFPGLDDKQLNEEIGKAKLKLKNGDWIEALNNAEDHPLFQGQIAWLLRVPGVDDSSDAVGVGEFIKTYRCLDRLFQKDQHTGEWEFRKSPFLLYRALLSLSKGDYMPSVGSSWSFSFDRTEWRNAFERKDCRDSLRELVKTLSEGGMPLEDFVVTEAEKAKPSIINADDAWWRYLLWCPEAIEYCRKGRIRWIEDATADENNSVLLVTSERLSGDHAELRSYVLFLRLKQHPATLPERGNLDVSYSGYREYESHVTLRHKNDPQIELQISHPRPELPNQQDKPFRLRIVDAKPSTEAEGKGQIVREGWFSHFPKIEKLLELAQVNFAEIAEMSDDKMQGLPNFTWTTNQDFTKSPTAEESPDSRSTSSD